MVILCTILYECMIQELPVESGYQFRAENAGSLGKISLSLLETMIHKNFIIFEELLTLTKIINNPDRHDMKTVSDISPFFVVGLGV